MKRIIFMVSMYLLTFCFNASAQMTVDSNGNIGMGIDMPDHGLHIAGINDALHIEGTGDGNLFTGGRITFGDVGFTYIEETADDVLTIKASEINLVSGVNGFGVSSPFSKIDVSHPQGYRQLSIRTSYTPTGPDDSNGITGSITWDDDYLYIRTSLGWKRTALSTW